MLVVACSGSRVPASFGWYDHGLSFSELGGETLG